MTGKVTTMAGQNTDANQEVLTPASIALLVEELFDDKIALDPCAPTNVPDSFIASRYVREAEDGLSIEWVDMTYINPPFSNLKPWLEKAMATAKDGRRVIALVPVRSWRTWFFAAMKDADRIIFLPPTAFVGNKSAYPFPLCLLCWNCGREDPHEQIEWRNL